MFDDLFARPTNVFPAPWDDPINKIKPLNIRDLLYWCEYIFLNNDLLAAALKKLAAHFVTELEVEGLEAGQRDKVLDFFYNILDIRHHLFNVALDYLVYGNCFVSVSFPVEKTVQCPNCFSASSSNPMLLETTQNSNLRISNSISDASDAVMKENG